MIEHPSNNMEVFIPNSQPEYGDGSVNMAEVNNNTFDFTLRNQ